MNIEDFLAHVAAREAGKRMGHMAHAWSVFVKAEDRERFLSEPHYVEVPTEAEWEARCQAMHAAQETIIPEPKPMENVFARGNIVRSD